MGIEQVTPLLPLLSQHGFGVVAGGIVLSAFVYLVRRSEGRVDRILNALVDRVVHGDGNGQPSLSSIQTTLTDHGERLTTVEAEVKRIQAKCSSTHPEPPVREVAR